MPPKVQPKEITVDLANGQNIGVNLVLAPTNAPGVFAIIFRTDANYGPSNGGKMDVVAKTGGFTTTGAKSPDNEPIKANIFIGIS